MPRQGEVSMYASKSNDDADWPNRSITTQLMFQPIGARITTQLMFQPIGARDMKWSQFSLQNGGRGKLSLRNPSLKWQFL